MEASLQQHLTTKLVIDDGVMYVATAPSAADDVQERICESHHPKANADVKLRRKLFFGGVASHIDQQIFTVMAKELGRVERCWLAMRAHPEQGHRGFGFAIYRDATSITNILGDDGSLIWFRNGEQLDVKRAIPTALCNNAV